MTTRTPEEIAGETIAELQAIEGVAWDEDTIARATVVAVWAVRSAVAAETEVLRNALEPFAKYADVYGEVFTGRVAARCVDHDYNDVREITVENLRAARAAIREKEPTR